MSNKPLPQNLRLLCSHYRSVAEACRRMAINRQQFNKYLAGETVPSLHNLHLICDFFGVDEGEIFLPHAEFAAIVLARRPAVAAPDGLRAAISGLEAALPDSQERLRQYCGYYFTYVRSPANPGRTIKAIATFFQSEGRTYSKAIERLVDREGETAGRFVFKYSGVLCHVTDRIFLFEYEPVLNHDFATTVLYPSHRSRIVLLSGLCLSVARGSARQPFAARVAYQYLGERIDLRAALKSCGLYGNDSPQLDAGIRSRIDNLVDPHDSALCAFE